MTDPANPTTLRKRDRLRKITEAEEAIVACESAISRAAEAGTGSHNYITPTVSRHG
jgi:hypothetical protein